MTPVDYLTVATIVRTHGLKGEVAVTPVSVASLSFLEGVCVWLVPPPSDIRQVTVDRVRQGPRGLLMRFSEIRSIDAASRLIGCEVLAPAELVPHDSYDDDGAQDVEGFLVTDPIHGELGVVVSTIITGANDVWVIEGAFGEVLVPVIDHVVESVDRESRHIVVRLLDGLLPEGSAK